MFEILDIYHMLVEGWAGMAKVKILTRLGLSGF